MARVPVASANAAHDLEPCLVFDRTECVERCDRIGLGVDWPDLRSTARGIASVERGNLRFLNASGIGQEVGAQVDRAARGPDRSAESSQHQLRQQAAVVDMSVGQEYSIDVGWTEGKGAIIQCLQGFR